MRHNLLLCPGDLVLTSQAFFKFIFPFFYLSHRFCLRAFWTVPKMSSLKIEKKQLFVEEKSFFLLVLHSTEFAGVREKVSRVGLLKFLEGGYLLLY